MTTLVKEKNQLIDEFIITRFLPQAKILKINNTEYVISDYLQDDILNIIYQNPNIQDEHGRTILMWASRLNRINEFYALFDEFPNIDINIIDNQGKTALLFTLENRYDELSLYLINRIDININYEMKLGDYFQCAFNCASDMKVIGDIYNHPKLNKQQLSLYKHNFKRNKESFEFALDNLEYDKVGLLFNGYQENKKHDPNVKITGNRKIDKTLQKKILNQRVIELDTNFINYLLTKIDDVNVKNEDGLPFLHYLILESIRIDKSGVSIMDIMKIILENPITDVNIKDAYGNTALMLACFVGNEKLVQWLLNHANIDYNTRNRKGKIAYDFIKVKSDIRNLFPNEYTDYGYDFIYKDFPNIETQMDYYLIISYLNKIHPEQIYRDDRVNIKTKIGNKTVKLSEIKFSAIIKVEDFIRFIENCEITPNLNGLFQLLINCPYFQLDKKALQDLFAVLINMNGDVDNMLLGILEHNLSEHLKEDYYKFYNIYEEIKVMKNPDGKSLKELFNERLKSK